MSNKFIIITKNNWSTEMERIFRTVAAMSKNTPDKLAIVAKWSFPNEALMEKWLGGISGIVGSFYPDKAIDFIRNNEWDGKNLHLTIGIGMSEEMIAIYKTL